MALTYELQDVEVWDGNTAACHALRQARIDVVCAYPITPSTPIVQNYGSFVSDGYIDGEFVLVESEHAAMSGCVGAAAAGGRVATATSSQGLALMVEVLYQASGMRVPIVLNLVNRALASPLNIHGDHSDMYLCRDAGWLQLSTCNPQEAYDFNLMSFKIAEDLEVRIPTIVNQDGFLSSHTAQVVRPLSDEEAYEFIGDYKAKNAMLDFDRPVTYGVQAEEDWHYEHKAQLNYAIMNSSKVIERVFKEFEVKTGRKYNVVEQYDSQDADLIIFAIGTSAESARVAAKKLRKQGIRAGVVTIRVIRPFPYELVGSAMKNAKAIAVMDKSSPGGALGAMFNEVSAALLPYKNGPFPIVSNYIYGLGERDLTQKDLEEIFATLDADFKATKLTHPLQQWIGLRGAKIGFFNV